MTHRADGIKKSNFVAQPTLAGTDTLDFVTGSTNKKITFADFLTQLGVTGTIVQDGDVLGTPVLDVQGTVNRIRNIENGAGVKASVSPENGITLDLNLTIDATGEKLLLNPAEVTPDLVSLVEKLGITLTTVNNTVEIKATLAQTIQVKTTTYQILVGDDIVNCTGTFNATLPAIANAIKEVTITEVSGTITILGDASIQSPTNVTTGSSVTLYPAGGSWHHK